MKADPAATPTEPNSEDWPQRLRSGDRRALAGALTAVENDTPRGRQILADIRPVIGNARVAGFTGSPGVGKSTLVDACISELRRRNLTVAVVAVDPSSVFSGGAVLGDRVRMQAHAADPGVFIRSLASRGQLGGLSQGAARVIDVLDAAGTDIILVETVGTGQSEIDVAAIAQVRVVIIQPGTGDSMQAMKAGVLEIADVLVVNKADLPLADLCVTDLKQMLSMRSAQAADIPIIKTVALREQGIEELVSCLLAPMPDGSAAHATHGRTQSILAAEASRRIRQRMMTGDWPGLRHLSERVDSGELSLEEAVEFMMERLGQDLEHD